MDNLILSKLKSGNLFNKSLIGIEREALRVKNNGYIAVTPHPVNLGSALTNPYITTDFSESLIEIVTPALNGADQVLEFLENTLHYVYKHLPTKESLWANSMPCVINGVSDINIAQYGKSNQGIMKNIYRHGLANRYGKTMQVIAGIHFNYSFSNDFWIAYQKILNNNENLQDFIDKHYMHLIRNVLRYGWIIYYLFGASSCLCSCFLDNYKNHNLIKLDKDTLHEPFATSLRMGDIGYQNSCEDEAGIKANYNSIKQYVGSLQSAMKSPHLEYEDIGLKKNGKYLQLNTNILQIENEYYSSVRPKPKLEDGILPSISLDKNGIEYVELRGIDINPLNKLGIDKEQILFLESFLLFCLLEDSKPISSFEQVSIDNNNQKVAHNGRDKNIILKSFKEDVLLRDWAEQIMQKIVITADVISNKHKQSVLNLNQRFKFVDKTPSSILINKILDSEQNFTDFTNNLSKNYKQYFADKKVNNEYFIFLNEVINNSIKKTKKIEKSDNISFDEFLFNYFKQL